LTALNGRRTGGRGVGGGTGHHAGDRADRCLRTLATHPVDYLIVPAADGMFVAMPLLTVESIAVGIGWATWWVLSAGYRTRCTCGTTCSKYTKIVDLNIGLTKSMVFGGIIAIIGLFKA